MRPSLPILLPLFTAGFLQSGTAQWCNYPAKIATSKDYCVGSTLTVSSTHTLQTITWYRNGQPVDTVKAAQYLDPNGAVVAGGHGDGNANNQVRATGVAVDDAGNVYVSSNSWNVITKWAPGASSGVVVADGKTNNFGDIGDLYLDQQNNLYVNDFGYGRMYLFPPGSSKGTIVATFGPNKQDEGSAMDCAGNIYLSYNNKYEPAWGDDSDYTIYQFPPGSITGTKVAGGNGFGPALNQVYTVDGIDQAGNLFSNDQYQYDNGTLLQWAPGAPAGSAFATGMPSGPLLVTGDDTVYLGTNDGNSQDAGQVERWSRGGAHQAILGGRGSGTRGDQLTAIFQMTIDIHGNFYVCDVGNYRVVKFSRSSTIDPTFTPTTTGKYYAIVKDFRGYSVTSDTAYINDPQAGPPTISITATDTSAAICIPITFTALASNTGAYSSLQWEVSGVKVGNGSPTYTNSLFADSDRVYCILTAQAGCSAGLLDDTSNVIQLHIDPHGAATVAITASSDTVCIGTPVKFIAVVTNGAAQPAFQWQVDGVVVPGDDSSSYQADSLQNGDVVFCQITSDDVCGLAKSNSIPISVDVPPTIAPNQVFTIKHGGSLTLTPAVTGTVSSWLWTPGTGLSDSTTQDPVASPPSTTTYLLKVTSTGCPADSGTILVDVFTPLSLPGGFTPNGDGHNDRFYVLGGPVNSEVESMEVYNRWGQVVFHTQHAVPGDANAGWDGRIGGAPAPAGTYVYEIVMRFAGGGRQMYKGTVVLIR